MAHRLDRRLRLAFIASLVLLSCSFPSIISDVATVPPPSQESTNDDDAPPSPTPAPTDDFTLAATPLPEEAASIVLPAALGELTFEDGQWVIDGEPVALTYVDTAAGQELWITPVDFPESPIVVRDAQGEWRTGFERWNGTISFTNTLETPVHLVLSSNGSVGDDDIGLDEDLDPFEFIKIASFPPGTYFIQFTYQGEQAFDLHCTLQLANNVPVSFVITPMGVAVAQQGFEPQALTDLIVGTSPICGGE